MICVASATKGSSKDLINIDDCPCCEGSHTDLESKPHPNGGIYVKCPGNEENTIIVRVR